MFNTSIHFYWCHLYKNECTDNISSIVSSTPNELLLFFYKYKSIGNACAVLPQLTWRSLWGFKSIQIDFHTVKTWTETNDCLEGWKQKCSKSEKLWHAFRKWSSVMPSVLRCVLNGLKCANTLVYSALTGKTQKDKRDKKVSGQIQTWGIMATRHVSYILHHQTPLVDCVLLKEIFILQIPAGKLSLFQRVQGSRSAASRPKPAVIQKRTVSLTLAIQLPQRHLLYFMQGLFYASQALKVHAVPCISDRGALNQYHSQEWQPDEEAAGSWHCWLQANQGAGWRMAIVNVKYHLPWVILVY